MKLSMLPSFAWWLSPHKNCVTSTIWNHYLAYLKLISVPITLIFALGPWY